MYLLSVSQEEETSVIRTILYLYDEGSTHDHKALSLDSYNTFSPRHCIHSTPTYESSGTVFLPSVLMMVLHRAGMMENSRRRRCMPQNPIQCPHSISQKIKHYASAMPRRGYHPVVPIGVVILLLLPPTGTRRCNFRRRHQIPDVFL